MAWDDGFFLMEFLSNVEPSTHGPKDTQRILSQLQRLNERSDAIHSTVLDWHDP